MYSPITFNFNRLTKNGKTKCVFCGQFKKPTQFHVKCPAKGCRVRKCFLSNHKFRKHISKHEIADL